MTQRTCSDFFDDLCNMYFFDTFIDECYWEGGMTSKDQEWMLKRMSQEATNRGITLTDTATWDYETAFENFYECSEKGLS